MTSEIENTTLQELATLSIFSSLKEEELVALTAVLRSVEVKSGRYIYREKSPGSELAFIVSGKVKVCKGDRGGREALLAILGPGEVIGEISTLTNSTRTADVVALTRARLLVLTAEALWHHLTLFSGLSRTLLIELADRVRRTSARVADIALYDVTCRVARVLFEMSVLQEQEGEYLIATRPTHQELANMVGASREGVTRALKVLVENKHIGIDSERIFIYSVPEF